MITQSRKGVALGREMLFCLQKSYQSEIDPEVKVMMWVFYNHPAGMYTFSNMVHERTYTPHACDHRWASAAASRWVLSETWGCTPETCCCSPHQTQSCPLLCPLSRPCHLVKPKHRQKGDWDLCDKKRRKSRCLFLREVNEVPWCWRSEHWERGSPFLMSCRLVRLGRNHNEIYCIDHRTECTGNKSSTNALITCSVCCTVPFQPLGGNVTQCYLTFRFSHV